MTLQEAERINGLCLDHSMWRMGLRPKPDSLADYTLLQLIEARDIVQADSDERMKQPGPKRLPVICDDRLLAALYVAYHYAGCDPSDIDPICVSITGNCVVSISLTQQQVEEVGRDAA